MSAHMVGSGAFDGYRTGSQRPAGSDRLFLIVLVALLIVSANVGLINQLVATKDEVGKNIIGLRDIMFVCAIGVGLRQMKTRLLRQLGISGIAVLVVLGLTPVSALTGMMKHAEPWAVVVEVGTMLAWALGVVIPTALRRPKSLDVLHGAVVLTGLTVALGVLFETYTQMRFPVVTGTFVAEQVRNHVIRSTPSGWPTMVLCVSLLATSVLFDGAGHRNRRNIARCLGLLVCLLATLLTQSRTLLVGMGAGFASSIIMAVIAHRRLRLRGALLLMGTAAGGLFLALVAGDQLIRVDFREYLATRYSVLLGQGLDEYALTDTRQTELDRAWAETMQSPVSGLGMGVPYREVFYSMESSGVLAHNVVAYFLTRYGFPGLLALLLFAAGMIVSQYRVFRDTPPRLFAGLGFASGVASLLVCAWFGNVFATPYYVQQAMLGVGIVLAYERFGHVREGSGSRKKVSHPPFAWAVAPADVSLRLSRATSPPLTPDSVPAGAPQRLESRERVE